MQSTAIANVHHPGEGTMALQCSAVYCERQTVKHDILGHCVQFLRQLHHPYAGLSCDRQKAFFICINNEIQKIHVFIFHSAQFIVSNLRSCNESSVHISAKCNGLNLIQSLNYASVSWFSCIVRHPMSPVQHRTHSDGNKKCRPIP